MSATARTEFAPIAADLWTALDDHIHLKECEIYSYIPGKYSSVFINLTVTVLGPHPPGQRAAQPCRGVTA